MDPNTAPTNTQPNAPEAQANTSTSAENMSPSTTETTTPPSEPKKSLLDSIMSMFGMGPKTPEEAAQTQPETPINPGTPQDDAPIADTTIPQAEPPKAA